MANPIEVKIVGNALNSQGFTGENTIAGLGLNTFGFLWPSDAIWTSTCSGAVTVWVESALLCSGDNNS